MKAHQYEGRDRLLSRSKPGQGFLLTMPPRLGKSVSSVEAAYQLTKDYLREPKILVVSPVTIIDGWIEEVHKWWRGKPITIRKCHGNLPDSLDGWTFTNYETIRNVSEKVSTWRWRTFWPAGYDLIIIDESVKIKSHEARLTKAIGALIDANPQACYWLLSANPAPLHLGDLWTQLSICDPIKTPASYWDFVNTYCVVESTYYGAKITGNKPGAEHQIKADYAHCMWSPSSAPPLTPITTRIEEVEMGPEQARIYEEMEAEFRAILDQMTGTEILAPNTMVQALRLIQIASNPVLIGGKNMSRKWDRAFTLAQELPGPTIIWTAFKDTVQHLSDDFYIMDIPCGKLTGDTTQKQRTKTRHDFQNGKLRVLLAHPGVGKFGLNLSAARSVIWLERSWSGDDYYQAGYRARHLEQVDETVEVVELLSTLNRDVTIDHVVHNVLMSRTNSTTKLTAADLKGAWRR